MSALLSQALTRPLPLPIEGSLEMGSGHVSCTVTGSESYSEKS